MSRTESYMDKVFVVADPDARIRKADNLMDFERYGPGDTLPPGAQLGDFKRIQLNSEIKVDKVKTVPTGSTSSMLFVHALPTVGTAQLGWTSSRNLRDKFVNVTLGAFPPVPGADRHGPNAAWSGGTFTGQITLVQIMDVKNEVKRIAIDTLDPYMALVTAAASDGIRVGINSAFRSYPEQRILYDGYQRGLPGFNKAAPPGHSNHQNGIAFDIAVGGGSGDPTYDWLKKNAPGRGFVRTVTGEPWHWEYDRAKAAAAVAAHTYKTPNVND